LKGDQKRSPFLLVKNMKTQKEIEESLEITKKGIADIIGDITTYQDEEDWELVGEKLMNL
jgi:hypothetical protein